MSEKILQISSAPDQIISKLLKSDTVTILFIHLSSKDILNIASTSKKNMNILKKNDYFNLLQKYSCVEKYKEWTIMPRCIDDSYLPIVKKNLENSNIEKNGPRILKYFVNILNELRDEINLSKFIQSPFIKSIQYFCEEVFPNFLLQSLKNELFDALCAAVLSAKYLEHVVEGRLLELEFLSLGMIHLKDYEDYSGQIIYTKYYVVNIYLGLKYWYTYLNQLNSSELNSLIITKLPPQCHKHKYCIKSCKMIVDYYDAKIGSVMKINHTL
jgi:hypothetical protein